MHLSLTANPSHLEAVDPVVLGKARAKQSQNADKVTRSSVLPLLLHGDAAFAGQGVVAECFAMSGTKGFRTGGTIHFIVNNQLGFTTAPAYARSSPYPSDVALMVQAPIFHVNGDDPEAVVHCAKIATEFRQLFHKDVVIDMFCYRRFGHNEGDEPAFTQPLMYKAIRSHPSTLEIYSKKLIDEGVMTKAEVESMIGAFEKRLEEEFEVARSHRPNKADWLDGRWTGMEKAPRGDRRGDTDVDLDTLKKVGRALSTAPENFHLHKTLQRQLQAKAHMFETGRGIDWATGEALAFGTLLDEEFPVRLSGQDSSRGTFSQRHSALVDQENEDRYVPLEPHPRRSGGIRSGGHAPLRSRRARLRVWLQPRGAARAGAVGSAVRRFRQRRAGDHRPVHRLGRDEMAAHVRPRAVAAAWLRRPGAGAFVRAARAVPAALRRRQHAGREPDDAGELLPCAEAADAAQLPQAAGGDDAEIAAPPQARGVEALRVRTRLVVPSRAVGRRAIEPRLDV